MATSLSKCRGVLQSFRRLFTKRDALEFSSTDGAVDGRPRSDKSRGCALLAPPAKSLTPLELLSGLLSQDVKYAFSCAFTLWWLIENDFPALHKKLTNEKFGIVIEAVKSARSQELRDELLKILCFLSKNGIVNWNGVDKQEKQKIVDVLLGVLRYSSSTSNVCRHSVRLLLVCECDIDKSFELLDGCTAMLMKDYSTVTVVGREIVEYTCMLIGYLFRDVRNQKKEHIYAHYLMGNSKFMKHIMNYLVEHNPADVDVDRNGLRLSENNTVEVFVWEYFAELFVDLMFFSLSEGIVYLYSLGFFDCMFELFQKPHHQGRFKAARLLDEAFEKDSNFFNNVLAYHNAKTLSDIFMEVLLDPNADQKRTELVISFTHDLFRKTNEEQLRELCELGLVCAFFRKQKFETPCLSHRQNEQFRHHCAERYFRERSSGEYCICRWFTPKRREAIDLLNNEQGTIRAVCEPFERI